MCTNDYEQNLNYNYEDILDAEYYDYSSMRSPMPFCECTLNTKWEITPSTKSGGFKQDERSGSYSLRRDFERLLREK